MQTPSTSHLLQIDWVGYGSRTDDRRPPPPRGLAALQKIPYIVWGTDPEAFNLYPQRIERLLEESAPFRVIVDRNAGAIRGRELLLQDDDTPREILGTRMTARQYLDLIGVDGRFLEALSYDLALWNGLAFQVGFHGQYLRVNHVRHTRFSRVRVARPPEEGDIPGYYICPDWSLVNNRGNIRRGYEAWQPRRLPRFVPEETPGPDTRRPDTQLLYEYCYSPVADYYPVPDVESCFEALQLGVDLIEFQKHFVQNGMTGSAIIYIPYVPQDTIQGGELSETDREQVRRIKEQIRRDLTGKENAGQVAMVVYNPMATDNQGNPLGVPRIEAPVQEQNDTKFIEIQREIRQSYLTGLNIISPELFGIPSDGGFSSQAEMLLTANELHYNLVIRPKQNILLRALEGLLRDAGFDHVRPDILPEQPVSRQVHPSLVKLGILTADEYRAQMGLEPLPTKQPPEIPG